MGLALTILAAVFLASVSLLEAASDGILSLSAALTLVLPAFGAVYVLLTFSRVCRPAR
jgi:hypothetical protein